MAKKLLTIVKPPKPISEMSDDELDAFADQIFESAAAAHRETDERSGGEQPPAAS